MAIKTPPLDQRASVPGLNDVSPSDVTTDDNGNDNPDGISQVVHRKNKDFESFRARAVANSGQRFASPDKATSDKTAPKPTRENIKQYLREFLLAYKEVYSVQVIDGDKKANLEERRKAIIHFAACEENYENFSQLSVEAAIPLDEILWMIFDDQWQRIDAAEPEDVMRAPVPPLLKRARLLILADVHPNLVFEGVKSFQNQKYYGEIIEKAARTAAEKFTYTIFQYSPLFKGESYYDDVVEKAVRVAVEKNPSEILAFGDILKGKTYYNDIVEKAVRNLVENNAPDALRYYDVYKTAGYSGILLEEALRECAEKFPESVLEYYGQFKDRPHAKDWLEKAVRKLVVSRPDIVLRNSGLFIGEPYGEEILKSAAFQAAELTPNDAIINFFSYRDRPYAENVLKRASEKSPKSALDFVLKYESKPYAGKILKKALLILANKNPVAVFNFADIYFGRYDLKEAIKLAVYNCARENPAQLLSFASLFEHEDNRDDLIEKAVNHAVDVNPSAVFYHASLFQDKPYAKTAIQAAAEKDPWAFNYHAKDAVIRDLFGDEYENFTRHQEERVKMAGEAEDFLGELIRAKETPLDVSHLSLYLMKLDRERKRVTALSGGDQPSNFITVPQNEFRSIFLSAAAQSYFNANVWEMTYMNAFSVTHAVHRNLIENGLTINEDNIRIAINKIDEGIKRIKSRELFGPNTKLIVFAHEENRFDNEEIIKRIWLRSGGKREDILLSAKGIKMDGNVNTVKESVLKAVREAKIGQVTILFNGHGSQENWAFAQNSASSLDHSLASRPTSINYEELGDALIASGNIKNINLIGSTCLSYDYLTNLFAYLKSKDVKERPAISIAEANKSQVQIGGGQIISSFFLESIYRTKHRYEPIRVEDFLHRESAVLKFEDPAFFVGGMEIM